MTDPRYDVCGGRPLLIDWHLNHHLFYTFELDTEEAERMVPDRTPVTEVRPGRALLSVGALRYEPGQFRPDSPVFVELVGAIHVAPDLSVAMPVPSMTFVSFSVYSDSPDFVEQEGRTLYTPTRLVPSLVFDYTPDGFGLDARDADGPILSMRNEAPITGWTRKEMWGQHYTTTNGLQHGLWEWDGSLFEHMRPTRAWKLHPHPFWAGLDVRRVRGCYRQMLLEPGTIAHERFYAMEPLD